MSARYAPGAAVKVARDRPTISIGRQHIRTPHYVRGLTGTIAEVMGPPQEQPDRRRVRGRCQRQHPPPGPVQLVEGVGPVAGAGGRQVEDLTH